VAGVSQVALIASRRIIEGTRATQRIPPTTRNITAKGRNSSRLLSSVPSSRRCSDKYAVVYPAAACLAATISGRRVTRRPSGQNRPLDKKSRQIRNLERILLEKVYQEFVLTRRSINPWDLSTIKA